MRHLMTSAAAGALLASSGIAMAGGVDRSGLGLGLLYEKGNVVELSYVSVRPTIDGSHPVVPMKFGNIAENYSTPGLAMKMDVNSQFSLGLQFSQPYGSSTSYPASQITGGSSFGAQLNSDAITLMGRYKINDSFSGHAGVYRATVGGTFDPPAPAPAAALVNIKNSSSTGYALGAAWEKPEIAARVALTWFSGTKHSDPTSASSFNAPQAANLDFQTGVTANTLVFGSVRWGEWSDSTIVVADSTVASWSTNSFDYSLGVGHKFNDNWSGAITIGYTPKSSAAFQNALDPTNGRLSLGLGVSYTQDNWKVSVGVQQINLGDGKTSSPAGNWSGNTATAAGVKIAYSF